MMPDPGADTVKIPRQPAWHRLVAWSVMTLGVLCLLIGGGWLAGRGYVKSRIVILWEMERSAKPTNPAEVVERLKPLDYLPDFIVYPVLIETVNTGSWGEMNAALELIVLRAYGGVRISAGYVEKLQPVPGAKQWIAKLPRQLLEDLYAVTHHPPVDSSKMFVVQAGSELIRVLEPDNPKWQGVVTVEEWRAARARVDDLAKSRSGGTK